MRIFFLLIFNFILLKTYCNEWLTRADFIDKSEGYIVEKNGDTTLGLLKMDLNDKIIIETKKEIITINPVLVRKIYLHNQSIIPLFLNDSTELVYGIVMDTVNKFKIYKGYEFANSLAPTSGVSSYSLSLKIYFRTCFVVLSAEYYDAILFSGTNLKRILRKNFSDDPAVVKYLDTFKNIPFEDVPKIIEQINVILK